MEAIENVEACSVNSPAEDLFVQIFEQTLGPDKAGYLFIQYPFVDIYGRHRFIDFAIATPSGKIAIEIDGENYHNPKLISDEKYIDDLLKQNSLVFEGWKVYRWAYRQLAKNPERVRDELITFMSGPLLEMSPDYLPQQTGRTIEYRDYQEDALKELSVVREQGESIALLYHATGVGKTITAAADAKRMGGRTLFLVNSLNLIEQARSRFNEVWPEATTGVYTGSEKDTGVDVLFATMQSVVRNLDEFGKGEFDYIIIDECHHAASKSYSAIMSYFTPSFMLGLTATPERADGEDLLKIFKNVAHKMDLETAVKRGILSPIRCFRVKTNIDLSNVRFRGIQYNHLDLETKLFIPARNKLIVDTYLAYAENHNTVIFCASVAHADMIRDLLRKEGVSVESVSGRLPEVKRKRILSEYERGSVKVLCACDLLNEGWDSPKTDVLFMARPTMSRTVYLQQLGRGVRKHEGKESLIVFDFVDNAGLFNMPFSLHRVLNIGKYRPFEYTLAPETLRRMEEELRRKGERPEALIDIPVYATDYEQIELFNWQELAKSMISQMEFVRRVDVQAETVDRYIKDGRIKADMAVPISSDRVFNYFKTETIEKYAKEFGWEIINRNNIRKKFLEFVEKMDMAYSYKPVLLLAMMNGMDERGRIDIENVVQYFIEFYADRRSAGLKVEKDNSLFCRENVSTIDAKRNILSNPFKRFADMSFMAYGKDLERIEFDWDLFKRMSDDDWRTLKDLCEKKLQEYYKRIA